MLFNCFLFFCRSGIEEEISEIDALLYDLVEWQETASADTQKGKEKELGEAIRAAAVAGMRRSNCTFCASYKLDTGYLAVIYVAI